MCFLRTDIRSQEMPALTGRKHQAKEQRAIGSRSFTKCLKYSVNHTSSESKYEESPDSDTEASSVSTGVQSNELEHFSEETAMESLERFYGVFDTPSTQGNLEERKNKV